MKYNFSFNSKTHDFWEIYEVIKEFYPIGIQRHEEGGGIYFEYSGVKKLENIIVKNIHDNKNFNERWGDFTKAIGQELNKEIIGTTYGQAPSFSSSIILERNENQSCVHTKELHFSVSLIGNFYQIYGLDVIRVLEKNKEVGHLAGKVVTTSPFEEFKESFEFVEQRIQTKYPNFRIVPVGFGQTIINGLQVRYLDDEVCSINQALFNQFLNEGNVSRRTRGDKYYGMDKWKKKDK